MLSSPRKNGLTSLFKEVRVFKVLRFGLRCERPRCQIASDVGRAMRTTKALEHLGRVTKKEIRTACFISGHFKLV